MIGCGLCTITMTSWEGALPLPGQYLRTPRGWTAFLIVEIRRPKRAAAKTVARFICERASPAAVPADAVLHTFFWNRR